MRLPRFNILMSMMLVTSVALPATPVAALDQAPTTAIRDVFAFVSREDATRLVFGVTLEPSLATGELALFDTEQVIQFNVDTNADGLEDRVIQATFTGSDPQKVTLYGPATPERTNGQSQIVRAETIAGDVSVNASPEILYRPGYAVRGFAGLRADPRNDDQNVLAVFVELPAQTVVPEQSISIDISVSIFAP